MVPHSAEDVLGSFFGRHTHSSPEALTLESLEARCLSPRAKTGMHPSNLSSSLEVACLSNIVSLSHERCVSKQHSHAASVQHRVHAEYARSGDTVTETNLRSQHSRIAPLGVMQAAAIAPLELSQVVSRRDVTTKELTHSPRGMQLLSWM